MHWANKELKHQSVQQFVTALFADLEMNCPILYDKMEKLFDGEGPKAKKEIDPNNLPWTNTNAKPQLLITKDSFTHSSAVFSGVDEDDLPF